MKLGRVALDGTKLRANASRHKAMSHERLEREGTQVARRVAHRTRRNGGALRECGSRRHDATRTYEMVRGAPSLYVGDRAGVRADIQLNVVRRRARRRHRRTRGGSLDQCSHRQGEGELANVTTDVSGRASCNLRASRHRPTGGDESTCDHDQLRSAARLYVGDRTEGREAGRRVGNDVPLL